MKATSHVFGKTVYVCANWNKQLDNKVLKGVERFWEHVTSLISVS